MPTWKTALRAADITRQDLRDDYTRQRLLVKKFAAKEYLAVRLLLPAALHASVIAAVAYMHVTDERVDTGATRARRRALAEWTAATHTALDRPASADNATLRAIADTADRHPDLRDRVDAFLRGAHREVDYAGFATEADLQDYVDGYSLPALMLTAGFLAPTGAEADRASFTAACRALIESMQRADFLDDLAEDAPSGVVGIPHEDLARHQLTVEDLARGRTDDAFRRSLAALVSEQTDLAQDQLRAASGLPLLVPSPARPFATALWQLQSLKLAAIRRAAANLADEGAHLPTSAALRVVTTQYLAARRLR